MVNKLINYTLVLVIIVMLSGCLSGAPGVYSDRTRYYDKQGKYTGQSIDNGYTIRYYDKSGEFIGTGRK